MGVNVYYLFVEFYSHAVVNALCILAFMKSLLVNNICTRVCILLIIYTLCFALFWISMLFFLRELFSCVRLYISLAYDFTRGYAGFQWRPIFYNLSITVRCIFSVCCQNLHCRPEKRFVRFWKNLLFPKMYKYQQLLHASFLQFVFIVRLAKVCVGILITHCSFLFNISRNYRECNSLGK